LDAIGTFGFRGEALSSLCRVCDGMEVVTKHESSSNAVRLKYDASGNLVGQTTAPGQVSYKIYIFRTLFDDKFVIISDTRDKSHSQKVVWNSSS